MPSVLFKEEQYFNRIFMWLIIGLGMIPMISIQGWAVYKQLILGEPWGNNQMSDTGLLIVTLLIFMLLAGLIMLLLYGSLETEVTKWGVRYRFTPFIPSWREILKQDITEYNIKKYTIFRGYGVRWSLDGVKTLNVRGTQGIEFHYEKKKKLLIGTQQPQEFINALNKMMNPDSD